MAAVICGTGSYAPGYVMDNDKIAELLTSHREAIQSEVLALEVRIGETKGYVKDWSINGEEVTLGVERP